MSTELSNTVNESRNFRKAGIIISLAAVCMMACTEPPRTASRRSSNNSNTNPDAGLNTAPDSGNNNSDSDTGTNTPVPDAGNNVTPDSGTNPPPRPDSGTNNPIDAGMMSPPDSGQPPAPSGLPILGNGQHTANSVNIQVIARSADGLSQPTDVAFNPGTSDLWVVNQGDSTFTVLTMNGTSVSSNNIRGRGAHVHFLAKPSALAFGDFAGCETGFRCMATSHDSLNDQPTITGGAPNDFMGPSLWTSDTSMFSGSGPYHNAHYDMLHNSPQGKGIAWESGNAYYIFDGYHESITRYDFHSTHGPGGSDHSDGEISRWSQGFVSGVNGVPSHLEFDQSSDILYIADTGNNRIASINTASGTRGQNYNEDYDGITGPSGGGMYYMQAPVNTVVSGSSTGMVQPSGLAINATHIFVSDFSTGRIWAFTKSGTLVDYLETGKTGIAGMTFDSNGALFVADRNRQEILKITP